MRAILRELHKSFGQMYRFITTVVAVLSGISLAPAQTAYTIQTVAGTSWVGDGGQARAALLQQPEGLAIDAVGNVYISDAGDHRIRRVRLDGTIETLAGSGFPGTGGSELNAPYGICLDRQGNLYIADLGNARVRRLSLDGRLTTVAGGGSLEPKLHERTLATTIRLRSPRNVVVDPIGNLYISDFTAHRIYKVDPQGYLQLVAGTGEPGYTGDGGGATQATLNNPAGLALDNLGALYIADSGNRRVRKVLNGAMSTVLDKSRKPIEFGVPTGVFIDTAQTLYVADRSEVTTVIRPDGTTITVPLGGAEVALDASNRIYTTGPRLVKRYDGRLATVVAGSSFGLLSGDGRPPNEWRFNGPNGLAQDSKGNLFIADSANGRIRQITLSGELRTALSGLLSPTALAIDSLDRVVYTDSKAGTLGRMDAFGKATTLIQNLKQPAGIAIDRVDTIYFADAGSNLLRRLSADGVTTAIAGAGFNDGDGPALECRLAQPYGLALDGKGGLVFSESGSGRIRRLDLGSFRITTILRTDLIEPRGIAIGHDQSLYIADAKLNRVLHLSKSGSLRPIAGTGESGLEGDNGPALAASFRSPFGILTIDGGILVADMGNGRIRRLQARPGEIAEIVAPPPLPSAKLMVQHAALKSLASVAPGQLVNITVENLSPAPDWQLTVNGIPTSILQTSPVVLATIPVSTRIGTAIVTLSDGGTVKATTTVEIVPSAPALFGDKGMALAVNQDGTINGGVNAAPRGSIIALYLTGVGIDPGLVSALADEIPATIHYAGEAPGATGVYQVNLELPAGFAPPGLIPITLSIGGGTTQAGMRVATR